MYKAAVIGCPINHSISPIIHQYWLEKYNIQGEYSRIHITSDALDGFFRDFVNHDLRGVNVTIPHKESIKPYCHHISDAAKMIGAINMVTKQHNNELYGDNSDYFGFITDLKNHTAYQHINKDIAIILGAGGAARAVMYALINDGFANIILMNRTLSKAEKIIQDFTNNMINHHCHITAQEWTEDIRTDSINNVSLVVNTSALGMKKIDFSLDFPFPFQRLPKNAIIYDVIYNPLKTWFMASAAPYGLTAINGLGMLLYQAIPGFQQWFDYAETPIIDQHMHDVILAKTGL